MRKRLIISLFVLLFVLLSSLGAKAQAPVCADLFRPALENVDRETRGLLLKNRTIDEVRADMGLIRRWKTALISRKLSSRDTAGLAGDLHLLFIEPRLKSLDIFRLLRDGDRFVSAWAEREILRNGLDAAIPEITAADLSLAQAKSSPRALMGRAKDLVLSKLPPRVMFLKDRPMSKEMLSRVLDHGVAGEIEALKSVYGSQKQIDYARALSPYARLVVYALAGYALQNYLTFQQDERGAQLVEDLSDTESSLDVLIAELKAEQSVPAR